MNEARMKTVLERTREHVVRHLEDLNDEIDGDNGRIKDHMVLDGLKDGVETLLGIKEMTDENGGSASADKTKSSAVSLR